MISDMTFFFWYNTKRKMWRKLTNSTMARQQEKIGCEACNRSFEYEMNDSGFSLEEK